jgi:hypothetical protein
MQRENGGNRPPFSSPIFQFKFTNDAGSFGSHLAHGGNPMPELDPDFQTVTLSVTLSNSELLRAARLGGLVVALNDFEAFDVSDHAALMTVLSGCSPRGILKMSIGHLRAGVILPKSQDTSAQFGGGR